VHKNSNAHFAWFSAPVTALKRPHQIPNRLRTQAFSFAFPLYFFAESTTPSFFPVILTDTTFLCFNVASTFAANCHRAAGPLSPYRLSLAPAAIQALHPSAVHAFQKIVYRPGSHDRWLYSAHIQRSQQSLRAGSPKFSPQASPPFCDFRPVRSYELHPVFLFQSKSPLSASLSLLFQLSPPTPLFFCTPVSHPPPFLKAAARLGAPQLIPPYFRIRTHIHRVLPNTPSSPAHYIRAAPSPALHLCHKTRQSSPFGLYFLFACLPFPACQPIPDLQFSDNTPSARKMGSRFTTNALH